MVYQPPPPPRPPRPPPDYQPAQPAPDWSREPPRAPPPPTVVVEPKVSIANMTAPVLLIVTMIPFLVALTWKATSSFERLLARVDLLDSNTGNALRAIGVQIEAIQKDNAQRSRELFTRLDHELWCAKTERVNPNWRCADPSYPPSAHSPPSPTAKPPR